MKVSKTAATAARRLFGLSHTDGRLDNNKLRTVFTRLAEDRPREYRAILAALHRLVRLDVEKRKVTVESAVELDPTTRQRVFNDLARKYGNDLDVQYLVNPVLLGGLRIRVGDDVFDGSVQGRLDRLAKAF
ncbi:F0F1 ATP synthase subunit delta [Luteolibacter sp. SL250]|uniref:F0F1 ATP synthase subunit delta n=1 Tax=Luteolibacter sp. SL250 TaxID=2995170 RepID=UPI002270CCCA|nr:F0F1 ATP synthase subunit delta [Luteolibacter sp. SL250]WAC20271.1 F0F1 ATP synthase subunit delta [Luteolibacter sp. SL250]